MKQSLLRSLIRFWRAALVVVLAAFFDIGMNPIQILSLRRYV